MVGRSSRDIYWIMEKYLEKRYKANKNTVFQKVQTEQFLELLAKKKFKEVLDVGCGRGFWSYVGARAGNFINLSECDVSDYFQGQEIEKNVSGVRFKLMKDEAELPFGDNTFDLVFSVDVLEHVKDDLRLVSEQMRVCKKGGKVIIGTPNYWRVSNILLKLIGRLRFPKNLGPDYYGDCIHLREYSAEDLKRLIVKASKGKLRNGDLKVYPCWMGVLALNLGIEKLPRFLNNYCHFFFIKFTKKW